MKNLTLRTLFGILYVGVLAGVLLFLPHQLHIFGALAGCLMLHEFYANSLGDSFKAGRILAALTVVLGCFSLWYVRIESVGEQALAFGLIPLLFLPFTQIFSKDRFEFGKFAYLCTGLLYIGLPVALLPVLLVRDGVPSGLMMLCFFILIWCSDVGAYCLGSLLGQRPGSKKLAPHISPKKSWWGVVGGILLCVGGALALWGLRLLQMPWYHCLGLGVVICVFATVGDLFESLWKRHLGIKDSGNAIPGHGGWLDRLDSSLTAIPAATIYLILFQII